MKHTLQVSMIIIFMFIMAQLIGLYAIESYKDSSSEDGFRPLPGGVERPDVDEATTPWLMIAGVLIGTLLILLLIKLKAARAWSIWFGFSIFVLSMIALSAFLKPLYAFLLSILFAFLKVTSQKISWIARNVPELFIYSGLAIIFAPILNVWGAVVLLLLISFYDIYAVWKSKHMVALANFQLESGRFAGFSIAYDDKNALRDASKNEKKASVKKRVSKIAMRKEKNGDKASSKKSAILGGGDVAFPLLFSSTLLLSYGWGIAIGATIGATIGLAALLFMSVKDRFYPAMPFIALGCFLGAAVVMLF